MTYEEMKDSIKNLTTALEIQKKVPAFQGFGEGISPRRYEMINGPYLGIYCFSDTLYTGPGPEVWKIYSGGWLDKKRKILATGTEASGIFNKYYALIRATLQQIMMG